MLSSLDGSTTGFSILGENPHDYLGKDVSGAGDVNGDGIADLIIGANGAQGEGGKKSGRSYVVYGKDGFVNPFLVAYMDSGSGFQVDGGDAYDGSGFTVGGAGDVDGDGFDDVLVGAWHASSKNKEHNGKAYVIYSVPGFV